MCKFASKNFTYIEVPKAGCTTIKHQMSMYFKEKLSTPPVRPTSELTKYMGYSRGPLPSNHDSLVFTVVRDPVARFISGLTMHAKNCHSLLPSAVTDAYKDSGGNANWFIPFIQTGDLQAIVQETHMTPIEFCIGHYLQDLAYVCSIENIVLLQQKLNLECGTQINFQHENRSSIVQQPTFTHSQLNTLLRHYGLQSSYDLIARLSNNHSDVINYDPSYWTTAVKERGGYYA